MQMEVHIDYLHRTILQLNSSINLDRILPLLKLSGSNFFSILLKGDFKVC